MKENMSRAETDVSVLAEFGISADDITSARESRVRTMLSEIEREKPAKGFLTLYRDSQSSRNSITSAMEFLRQHGYKAMLIKNFSKVKSKLADVKGYQASAGNPKRTAVILFIKRA